MRAGVSDVLEKPFGDDALLAAVRRALAAHRRRSAVAIERERVSGKLASLSNREREVVDGLMSGKANKVIAYDLGISARTVEVYRANVMTKLAARTLPDLVRMVTIAQFA
jgi:two-component system response regulator FixJ